MYLSVFTTFAPDMKQSIFNSQSSLRFKRFSNKGYSLFACLGRVVLVGVLTVPTLSHAKAGTLTTHVEAAADTLSRKEMKLDEVVVTGSRAPLTALQSAKIVKVITADDIHRAAVETVNDVLKLATGVDVRQRGGFGVQTDISINGGTFDQITILLNGVNISNPQTGHNATDFPVSLSDIERIEVLEGAAARVFGTSAFSGAINIVTRRNEDKGLDLNLQAGSFGTVGGDARVTMGGKVKTHVSAGYMRSDGGTTNSDFDKGHVFVDARMSTRHADLDFQLGVSQQDYGASTFYSAKYNDQWEKTTHLVTSLGATIKNVYRDLEIKPTVYYNKFIDHYQLIHGKTGAQAGENYHNLDVMGASVNAHMSWLLGKTAVGADLRHEHILSTAYGELMAERDWENIHGSDRKYDHKGSRTNASFFVEHNVILGGFTLSAGVLANRNTGLDSRMRFYPGIDLSYRPSDAWKLFASWNKALRMPTYTDLYTANSVQQGDRTLRPERNDTYKTGLSYRTQGVEATASAFYSRGKDMIDWVYATAESTKYKAMNIGRLTNMGYNVEVALHPTEWVASSPITAVTLGYARIHQRHATDEPIYRSLYALEYLRDKFTASLSHRIWRALSARWDMRWQHRMNGYHPYAKVDAKLLWRQPRYELYLKADNLTAHRYYDLGGVRQPGLWLMAGASIHL